MTATSDPKGHEWQSPPGHEKVTKTRVRLILHWVSLITPWGTTLGWGRNFFQCWWIYQISVKFGSYFCQNLVVNFGCWVNVFANEVNSAKIGKRKLWIATLEWLCTKRKAVAGKEQIFWHLPHSSRLIPHLPWSPLFQLDDAKYVYYMFVPHLFFKYIENELLGKCPFNLSCFCPLLQFLGVACAQLI